jgi:hypothetical protein
MWRPQANQKAQRITPPRQDKIVVNLTSEPWRGTRWRLTNTARISRV